MKLNLINKDGATLQLFNNDLFVVTNIDGMTQANSDISALTIGGMDGDYINNIQAQPRGIVLDLLIKPSVNVEDAKRAILSIIKLKQTVTLLWEQNNKVITIDGVVESVAMPRFSDSVAMQISLHCSQPFWQDLNNVVQQISNVLNLHYFQQSGEMLYFTQEGRALSAYDMSRTRTFFNGGDVAVGMTIEILAFDTVTNPIIYGENGSYFGVNVTMEKGDIIYVTTHRGNKTVTLNGTSVIDDVKPFSTWLQLQAGENTFSIDSLDESTDNVIFSVNYRQRYI